MSEAQEKLRRAKERLEKTDSWPWENIGTWVSSTTPLVKRAFGEFYQEFQKVTARPNWTMLPRFSSGGSRWDGTPPRDNFAEAAAAEEKANRRKAEQVKQNALAFLDGLLDLPAVEPAPAAFTAGSHTIHAGGDVNFGVSTRTSFDNSPVGAAATAPGAIAMSADKSKELKEELAAVQSAVVRDQDRLDDIHELLHDGLCQVLRSVRKLEFDQGNREKMIAQIKDSVDDIWVKQVGLGGVKVPANSEVAKAILASPVLAAALKGIIALA